MAWGLHIKGIGDGDPVLDDGPPLGGIDDVRSTIEAYFHDVNWETIGRGFWTDDDGVMEFKFVGEPVEVVWLRVQGCDCTDSLIAMAREKRWLVVDDSSGEDLESDTDIEDDLVLKLQRAAGRRKKAKTPVVRSKVKMPRITSRVAMSESHLTQRPNCIFVPLRNDEVTDDVFYEYAHTFRTSEILTKAKAYLGSLPEEVWLPNGQRLAVLIKLGHAPESIDMGPLQTYFETVLRPIATIHDGVVRTADGNQFDARECFWIERVPGRKRRVSGSGEK